MTDEVAKEFMRLIHAGQLRVGDRLPSEPDLAQMLGVGRSTLREAKRTLISLGILVSHGRTGTFVADPTDRRLPIEVLDLLLTEQRIEELHQARSILEGGAIRFACEVAKDDEITELESYLESWDELKSADFWTATVTFHEMLVRLCHSDTVLYLYSSLSRVMREQQMTLYAHDSDRHQVIELHRDLLTALRTRDPDTAADAMARHLSESHMHDVTVLRVGHSSPRR